MNSSTNICNMALAYLGQSSITSLKQDNERARWLGLFYEPVRDEVLRTHNWAFATREKSLIQVETETKLPGKYSYKYPADALFIRKIFAPQTSGDAVAFTERYDTVSQMRVLVTSVPQAIALYTRRITDETQFDPAFSKAFALALASDTALALTGDVTLASRLQQQYTLYIEEARRTNMEENHCFQSQTDCFTEAR